MKNPIVTIALPVFNAEKYIENTIQSILNQTFIDFELIVIDDGSCDGSCNIIKSFNDKRILLIENNKNRGAAYRTNQVINMAKGIFMAKMDADDIMHPDRLKLQVEYLIKKPHIDVLGSNVYSIDINNNIIGIHKIKSVERKFSEIIKRNFFAQPTIIGRVQWFRENLYDENIYGVEDYELWLRSFEKSHFENMELSLVFYREIGIPYISKYIHANNQIRKIIINYLSENRIKNLVIYKMILRTHLKDILLKFIYKIGMMNKFIQYSRNKIMVTNTQLLEAQKQLEIAIKSNKPT